MRTALLILFLCSMGIGCKQDITEKASIEDLIQKKAIVANAGIASAHPAASQIGLDILKAGGNAVDAAIATQFALAVCYPVAGNIGGGGFMVIRNTDGTAATLDFREMAPAAAHADMYLDDEGNVISGLSTFGHLASGVPGSVAGMVAAFDRYSKLKDWKALVEPSVKLASEGVELTSREASNLNNRREDFLKANTRPTRFTKDGKWNKGELLKQPELARVMEAIRDHGFDGFYRGWVADSIVTEMNRGDGIITHKDLENYKASWRTPAIGQYKGHQIISMPPPSSGGIALQQLLSSIEPYDIGSYGFQSKEAIHLMVEAERRVYADRATHLGDSDYYDVPIGGLMADVYNTSRMESFDPTAASKSDDIKAGTPAPEESEQTTHFSIVDDEGNAVSLTTTINTGYGSKVVVGGAGFFLNNEMDDFSAKPGVPNFFGLVGNEANSIQPGKRMLSSMSPSIVVDPQGKLKIVVGTPGGSTIITSVFQTIVNIIDFDMDASEATQACRFHHQWLPDMTFYEPECFDEELINSLTEMGHVLKSRADVTGGSGLIGKIETILVRDDGQLEVAADRRADDTAMGY